VTAMRIIGLLLLACLAIYALQIALVLLILAGLIFRTKETIGLMLVFGALALISKYPVPCLALAAACLVFSLYKKKRDQSIIDLDRQPELTNQTD
jgi:hypothetical protein